MQRNTIIILLLIVGTQLTSLSQHLPGVIPLPAEMKIGEQKLVFKAPVKIYSDTPAAGEAGEFLTDYLSKFNIAATHSQISDAQIIYQTLKIPDSLIGTEGYRIKIIDRKVVVQANSYSGLFYATQTLTQLCTIEKKRKISFPEVAIIDQPAFRWRGLMLDVARHMLPMSYIKQVVDQMAFYKLNTLHLHLTDDQGWRIEIKRYPKLQSVASKRKETIVGWQPGITESEWKFDGTEYGGYYTQEELKDLVEYAQKRNITIVPEIEMPGHTLALLSAYPELSCRNQTYKAATYWGVFNDILCPTEDAIRFLKNVLNEVCDVFPGSYIHIGGDEAPKIRWEESEYIALLMAKYKLQHVEEVQGWFNRRIEEYLNSKGRKLIGWDEILDGGISRNATVMSWRGEKGGIMAANKGNDVVMAPGSEGMYWDHAQGPVQYEPQNIGRREGNAPWNKVYNYYPVPKEIDSSGIHHILGMQANLWSEYIKTPEASAYLIFPRIMALSEAAWTPVEKKNWENFVQRTPAHFQRLVKAGINFRIPEPVMQFSQQIDDNKLNIKLFNPVPGYKIYYTPFGNQAGSKWFRYNAKKGIHFRKTPGASLKAISRNESTGLQSAPFILSY